MQQIYRRADMQKSLCNFIEIKLRHGCSPVNLLHIFRTPFIKNTYGGLLLETPRGVFKLLSNIYEEALSRKKFHYRKLTGSKIHLWHLWVNVNACNMSTAFKKGLEQFWWIWNMLENNKSFPTYDSNSSSYINFLFLRSANFSLT